MTLDQAVEQVQLTYPQVYHACHTRHQRKRSTDHRLSQRDAAILAHCSPDAARVPAQLARHLAIARSTLSEALKKLELLGYVRRVAGAKGDGRQVGILLTLEGLRAVRDTSVLEAVRLEAVLRCATHADRAAIAAGFTALADACRRFREGIASSKGGRT
ncbi:MAG TPA: MarR family winged helix-turn-helix transcriptional regulator [Gemmatimonadaceae bacterium]|jgi:DNA-binding MarR family transcriptional regulator